MHLESMEEDGVSCIAVDNSIVEKCFSNNQRSSTNHCHDFQKFDAPQRFSGKVLKFLNPSVYLYCFIAVPFLNKISKHL